MIQYNLFPGGKYLCMTMSFDDGRVYDRKLIEIFNHYGIKGTFHLNSCKLDTDDYITSREVKDLYKDHEIACHSVSHCHMEDLSLTSMINEIMEDRKKLENLSDTVVRGFSYPFGTYNSDVMTVLKTCGIEYARTVASTNKFDIPRNFLEWHPTLHIKTDIDDVWERFTQHRFEEIRLLYIWGHSYEFNDNQSWDMMERFCRIAAHHPDVWYATNIEIVDYLNALKQLKISADESLIINPTLLDLWISVNHQKVCIKSGSTLRIK